MERPDLNSELYRALSTGVDRPAVVTGDGQIVTKAQLERSVGNLADLLLDNGVGPGARVQCQIENFAVKLCSWLASWRIGADILSGQVPELFISAGLPVDFAITVPGQKIGLGRSIEVHPRSLTDQPGPQLTAQPGWTFFSTANTPRDPKVVGIGPDQILKDSQNIIDLLGPAKGAVYMSTGLDSMRAIRDALRALLSGQPIIGSDTSMQNLWPRLSDFEQAELMLTPLSLRHALDTAPDKLPCNINRIVIASGTARTEILKEAHNRFGDVIGVMAGTSESSVYAFKKFDPKTHEHGQIGQAVCGIDWEIRGEDGEPVATGEIGQLMLKVPTDQRFAAYVNSNSAYDSTGWFAPGFLAKSDNTGQVTKLGRTDDRLNLGGTRHFAGKIEEALSKLPSVQAIAAIRVYDENNVEALGLVVEPGPGYTPDSIAAVTKRALKGIGAVFVREIDSMPMKKGTPDRTAIENMWESLSE